MGSSTSLVRARATADEQEWVDDLVGILSPRTVRLLQEEETATIDWGRLALLSGFVLAPWAVLGSLVYVTWPLAS